MAKTGLTPTDDIVRRAIQGDGTAFTELWDTNIESLRAYLVSSLGVMDGFFVDDICSRSFEKAFRQIGSYDPSKSRFSTWLKVIAHNTALDVIESENRETRNMVSIDDRNVNVSELGNIEDSPSSALEDIIKNEDAASLRAGVEGLPDIYREVAFRRLIEGLPYKTIADELGIELNTVRTRIRRAKALLGDLNSESDD